MIDPRSTTLGDAAMITVEEFARLARLSRRQSIASSVGVRRDFRANMSLGAATANIAAARASGSSRFSVGWILALCGDGSAKQLTAGTPPGTLLPIRRHGIHDLRAWPLTATRQQKSVARTITAEFTPILT